MRSLLVTGATGQYGTSIADALRRDQWQVYTLQRHPPRKEEYDRWLDYDLMEPQQLITAVHQLWNEVNEKKTPLLTAVVHSAGANAYDTWKNVMTFDIQAALRLHVLEPLMLTRYMIEFGVMSECSTAVWLLDSRPASEGTIPQRMAKAGLKEMVKVFSTQLPAAFSNEFIECPNALELGAISDVSASIVDILQ